MNAGEQKEIDQYVSAQYVRAMPPLKATAFRLSEADIALMDALAAKVGVPTRIDVLRVAIHKLASLEGITPPSPKKKRPAKTAALAP